MSTPPLVVDTPTDPEFLEQFARASMLHAQLDNTLKMFVRSFDESTIEEALEYIGFQGAKRLRERVTKLAKEQLGEGEALTMILGFMKQCEEISDRRNNLLHSPIARERDGKAFFMRARGGNTWVELPKPEELKALADETFKLQQEMNHERLGGVIALALSKRKTVPRKS
jgi:geranylgeranyl pyrophosphate synthase